MSWEYDPCNDSSQDGDPEETMIKDYMDEIHDQALQKLTLLELAALFNDFKEFCIRYREERDLKDAESRMD